VDVGIQRRPPWFWDRLCFQQACPSVPAEEGTRVTLCRPPLLLLTVVCALGATALLAGEPRVLTLDEALELAFRQNPSLAAARHQVEAAEAHEDTAFAGYLPGLSLDASYARQTGNYVPRPGMGSFNASALGTSSESFNVYNFSLSLRQPIWDFGRTTGANDAAAAGCRAARQDLRGARLDLWALVVNRYWAVLASQQMLQVANRTHEQALRYADRARALFEAGLRPKIDVLRTESDALGAEAARVSAEDALTLSESALLTALGSEERFDFQVAEPPEVAEGGALPGLEAAVAEALSARPEVAELRARLEAQEGVLRTVRGGYFPSLSAQASFSYAGIDFTELVWNWSLGIGLSVPLLAFLSTAHQVEEASAQRAILEANLESLALSVRMQAEQALAQVADAGARLRPVGAAVETAREALKLAEGRYEAGTGNQVELLDAQAALANAEASQIRARYDLALAWTALRSALGRLPERFHEQGAGGGP
jgi:outer membrane protein